MANHDLKTIVSLCGGTARRLDLYAAVNLNLMHRSQLKQCGFSAIINGKKAKLSQLLKNGDVLELEWHDIEALNLSAEDIPLNIVYEDDNVVVINKKQGMVVHPGAGNFSGTLVNALLGFLEKKQKKVNEFPANVRPFIVHRLDKDTSGLIIAAFNMQSLSFLSEQFKNRKVKKTYIAIVNGVPRTPTRDITSNIMRDPKNRKRFIVSENKGRTAVTRYSIMHVFGGYSLLKLRPQTGRTHQLRVHLRSIGTPILGDVIYNKRDKNFPDATLMLHAKKLLITLPGNKMISTFSSDVPIRFKETLQVLSNRFPVTI